jgi:hypothetical protein
MRTTGSFVLQSHSTHSLCLLPPVCSFFCVCLLVFFLFACLFVFLRSAQSFAALSRHCLTCQLPFSVSGFLAPSYISVNLVSAVQTGPASKLTDVYREIERQLEAVRQPESESRAKLWVLMCAVQEQSFAVLAPYCIDVGWCTSEWLDSHLRRR